MSTFVAEAALKLHGGPPFVQSPLMIGSGPLSGAVSTMLFSKPSPAHEPVSAAGVPMCSFARIPTPEKVVFGTVHDGTVVTVALPVGPARRTAPFASSNCQM